MQQPTCPRCGGTGWIVSEVDEVSGATRCECLAEERSSKLEERAQIPPLYAKASLDNFSVRRDSVWAEQELKTIVETVRDYRFRYPDPHKPGLLLMGDPGTGKTHLAVAALRAIVDKGYEGLFFDYQALLDSIRASYSKESGISDKAAYKVALETEVLLLDDLGAHRVTDWVEDTVTAIITHRCNHRKTLIATTNLSDSERPLPGGKQSDYRVTIADRIGPRARSRLFEMCRVIRMPLVEDYRLRK